jgi:peptide/nickel transport system substrate-binding protein
MKIIRLILLLLIINVFLGACGEEPATFTPVVQTTAPLTQQANGTAAPITAASTSTNFRPDKEFIFGLSQEPVAFGRTDPFDPASGPGLDPANLDDQPSLLVTRQIFDTIFEFKPGSMQYQYAPWVKANGVSLSGDGLTYTIKIGGGLLFSDGSPLDAEAIRWNFIRWSNPNSIYHKGEFSAYRRYFVELQGYSGYPGIIDLDGLKVEDRTLKVKLKAPMPSFFQVLSMPQFAIVSPASFDKNGNFIKPVGSGPYLVERYYDKRQRTEQRFMVLKKNPNYLVEKDPAKLPQRSIDTLVLKVLPGNQDGLRALKSGEISATDKIKPEDVPNNLNDPSFQLLRRSALNLSFLGINQTRPPFDREEVRQAFSYAINTTALAQNYYYGLGTPATGFLPPSTLGYVADTATPRYDPQKARELLVKAGYLNGIPETLELWVMPVPRLYYPDPSKISQAIIDDLAKINVKVVRRDESSWVNFNSQRDDGRYSLFMGGWQGENGDPEEFLVKFFADERKDFGYNNPLVRTLLKDIRGFQELSDRRPYYRSLLEQIQADTPVIPLVYMDWPVAVRRDVLGYEPGPNGIESWANLSFR